MSPRRAGAQWALLILVAVGWTAPVLPVHAYHAPNHEWVTGTAYSLEQGEFSLGLIRWEAGILDELMVGVNLLPWVVGPFFGTVVPTGHVKVRDWFHDEFAMSLEGQFLYIDGSALLSEVAGGTQSKLLSLMMTASGSARWNDDFSTSLQLTYTVVNMRGDSDGLAFEGAAVLDSLQLAPLLEWRFSPLLALHLQGRVLLYRAPPTVSLRYSPNDSTTVDAKLAANFVAPVGAWNVLPALAISASHVNFKLGAGYGHRWLPVMGLVFSPGLVVDFDFFVRF